MSCFIPHAALPKGRAGGTFIDNLWPPEQVEWVAVPRDVAADIVSFDDPDSPVVLQVFAWREGVSFSSRPEPIREDSLPAGRVVHWAPRLDPGRYLLTANVHWPYAYTLLSFGIEVE